MMPAPRMTVVGMLVYNAVAVVAGSERDGQLPAGM